MVPLCLVAKVGDKLIPVDINQFRNSPLGIKPLKYNICVENDASNKLEKIRVEKEIEEAKANPFHYVGKKITADITIISFLTMVNFNFH